MASASGSWTRTCGTGGQERLDQHQRRRLADVVGPGLERQAPDGDGLVLELAVEMPVDLLEEHVLLGLVDLVDGLHHPRGDALGLAHVDHGADVLGEATAAVADAREEEMEADPLVVADAAPHVVDVGPVGLAQVGHLVDEADLGGQQAVGDVLGHLGALGRHDQERPVGAEERGIQLVQPIGDLVAAHADHDAVGLVEVVDRRAFLEELGVAGDVERDLGDLGHPPGQLGVGADRDRALDHDDLGRVQVRRRSGGRPPRRRSGRRRRPGLAASPRR